jgi:hypothetical protein
MRELSYPCPVELTSMRWMGRIKIKIGNINEERRLRLSLWDSPTGGHQ